MNDKSNFHHRATAILMSYKRPFNIQSISQSVLSCDFIDRLIITNNNPTISIEEWVEIEDSRVVLLNQFDEKGCGYRWQIAKKESSEFFIAIDDDIFISKNQIANLFSRLIERPDVPHGVFGTVYTINNETIWPSYVRENDLEVDVIHQVYGVTTKMVDRYFEYLNILDKISHNLVEAVEYMADDIIMSQTGANRPRIHNLGHIPECSTSRIKGIAVHKIDGFNEIRNDIYLHITRMKCGEKQKLRLFRM